MKNEFGDGQFFFSLRHLSGQNRDQKESIAHLKCSLNSKWGKGL